MWHRHELKVYNHGYVALARHVLKQWQLDGKPIGDDVQLWLDIIETWQNKDKRVQHGNIVQQLQVKDTDSL